MLQSVFTEEKAKPEKVKSKEKSKKRKVQGDLRISQREHKDNNNIQ